MHATSIDLTLLDPILEEFKEQKGAVIPILQRAQDVYGYLPKEVLSTISKKTKVPISRLYGVVTFYSQFNLERQGRHIVRVCDGTACHVRGAPQLIEDIGNALNLKPGSSDPDYKYTLEIVYCLGSCGLAPVVVVDDVVYGKVKSEDIIEKLNELD
ncbi:MAG: NAD(P)H-dependent oxidoreductase subunit E [Anaerolineaceae bacterium 4572_5.1]|nr:MAG: NAD(P)H-dependent oxidoreductase subunit E [Anaerolineaceae bacterium 4572_5.1]RLD11717.1 MAG: NAD(P)H-dependent oxidoreductase subunit E [Chloroflexota bacterium]